VPVVGHHAIRENAHGTPLEGLVEELEEFLVVGWPFE
jgi:hypothetical protein